MVSASTQQPEAARSGGPRTAPPKRVAALIAVLGALTAVAPLATDMYVPAFPQLGEALHTSSSAVQLTMTAFLAGLVAGQLVIGPVSDGIGRRGLLVWGSVGFTLMSLVCAFAPNIQILTAARFLAGVCGAAGMVLARAVVTDLFHGRDIPRYFTLLSQVLGIAPIAAPVLGGAILSVSTWRATFAALVVIGVLLTASVLAAVPESLPPERRNKDGLGGTFRAMGRLTRDRGLMGYTLVLALISAALFTYIAGSSFVFEEIHGTSPTTYALIFASNAVGMLLANAVFARLARRLSLNLLLTCAIGIALAGSLAQAVLVATVGESFAGTWITLFLTMAGIGVTFPATMSLGQTLGRTAPGATSALMGGLQFLAGAVVSPVVGLFGTASSLPMALIMLTSVLLAALALLTLARPWLRLGEAETHGE